MTKLIAFFYSLDLKYLPKLKYIFGWVFSRASNPINTNTINFFHNVNLEDPLRSLWYQKEVCANCILSDEDQTCETFIKASTVNSYPVFKSLLVNRSFSKVHNNMIGALKRLIQLENTFLNRPLYSEAYRIFRNEYETLGHTPDVVGESKVYLMMYMTLFLEQEL